MQAFDHALTYYTEALRIDPTLSQSEAASYVKQGIEQARSGNREQAHAHFVEAIALYQMEQE